MKEFGLTLGVPDKIPLTVTLLTSDQLLLVVVLFRIGR